MLTKILSLFVGFNWIKVVYIIGALILGLLCVYVFKMKADGPIEQACEKVIEQQTGITVDFSSEAK